MTFLLGLRCSRGNGFPLPEVGYGKGIPGCGAGEGLE